MHTDGRNIDIEQLDVPVVMGKPILGNLWRGVGYDGFDGLFMVGLHTMQHTGSLLEHSYLREYDSIHLNGILLGEIGMEAALAGERGIPLKFVSGDDQGGAEGKALVPDLITCAVKRSLTPDTGVCLPPSESAKLLRQAAFDAVRANVKPFCVQAPYEIVIRFSECEYRNKMRELHPEIFADEKTVVMKGDNLLETWSKYLLMEKEMVKACQ
jgi:D-amino peptidase